jgi:hypothetical protein
LCKNKNLSGFFECAVLFLSFGRAPPASGRAFRYYLFVSEKQAAKSQMLSVPYKKDIRCNPSRKLQSHSLSVFYGAKDK